MSGDVSQDLSRTYQGFTIVCTVNILLLVIYLVLFKLAVSCLLEKEAVCKDITLKFYDPDLPISIETDASQNGIGVVLLQPLDSNFTLNENNIPMKLMPVAFASKTLTSAEGNNANIESELLGVVFQVLHFKHFTFGNEVNIITDHKPLVLLKKSLAACSYRL